MICPNKANHCSAIRYGIAHENKGVFCPWCGGRNYPSEGGVAVCVFCGEPYKVPYYKEGSKIE